MEDLEKPIEDKPKEVEKEKPKEYTVIVECVWNRSPNCRKSWTENAAIPSTGPTHGICGPCMKIALREAQEVKVIVEEEKKRRLEQEIKEEGKSQEKS